jgi:hypothetical protein
VKGLKIYARSHVFSYLGRRAEKLELQWHRVLQVCKTAIVLWKMHILNTNHSRVVTDTDLGHTA